MSKFQIILLVIFGVFILAAVLVFSFYKGSSSSEANVVIWGSMPENAFNSLINSAQFNDQGISTSYVERSPDILQKDFTEALARGQGPDLILISQDELWSAMTKLLPIPYESISRRDFESTFVQGGEIFAATVGIYAVPLVADPLVLYYNRDLLSAAGIAKPLAYWDEIYAQAGKLTKRDQAGNLNQTTIALGETKNIADFKEILSLLFLQAGSPITETFGQAGSLRSSLLLNPGQPVTPGESALDFYTQFANPSKPFYSWNRVLPDAQTYFASGDAAYYLGFASESRDITRKNPVLNEAVALVPQSRVSGKTLTFGRIYGLAISRGTKNTQAALTVALALASKDNADALGKQLGLPPVRRDLLAEKPAADSAASAFYDAALQVRAWTDPDPAATRAIFQEAIESVTSGRSRTLEALNNANNRINDLTSN